MRRAGPRGQRGVQGEGGEPLSSEKQGGCPELALCPRGIFTLAVHPTPGPSSPGPVPAGSASWVLQFTVRPKPGDGAGAAGGTAVQGPSGPAPPAICQGKSCRSLGTWGWPSPVVPFVPPEGLWAGEEVPW